MRGDASGSSDDSDREEVGCGEYEIVEDSEISEFSEVEGYMSDGVK